MTANPERATRIYLLAAMWLSLIACLASLVVVAVAVLT